MKDELIGDYEMYSICKNNNMEKCNCINKISNVNTDIKIFKNFECYAPECQDSVNYFVPQIIKNKQKRCQYVSCETTIDSLIIDKTSHIDIKNNCTMKSIESQTFDLENIYRAQSYDVVPKNFIFDYLFHINVILLFGLLFQ